MLERTRTATIGTLACLLVPACLLALTGCEKLDQLKPMKAKPTTTTPLEPELEIQELELPPVEDPVILQDLAAWNAASRPERDAAARAISDRFAAFQFARLETFTADGVSQDVAIFRHERMGAEFSLIPGGTFQMGSPSSEEGRKVDETRHEVRLTRPFLISRTEISQAMWAAHVGKNPATFKGDDLPIETVTVLDVERFLRRAKMDLPTEAQWEYACRAGTKGPYSCKKGSVSDYGWSSANSGERTHSVASKKPNPFGLFDMHGNVFEWCEDEYAPYPEGSVVDHVGAGSKDGVCRGGSWLTAADVMRSAFRYRVHPSDKQKLIGFRAVKNIPKP